ncbi:HlyD family efflux transporter periplasmic adaptor subunit [Rhizobium sp. ICMP 5592]|uniref:efflux RND transporter periplasmic adaptor subunit n=1 Tax=Rhizobium sp. ICMP 5592 TaxID=2292445 RepID=UPI0012952523|nr:HlyD family efflux transporter periplasmic adaptor subunit [Rhizobium sp. ICMP 5592]MQB41647.1 HlyD family efflux transporter periplasmic adaptor subunit [Rhizobium sp. ICMP 5592]
MNAEANLANRLRSLSIERKGSPPADAATSLRFPRRGVALVGIAVTLAAAAYMSLPLAESMWRPPVTEAISQPAVDTTAQDKFPSQPPKTPPPQSVIGSGYVVAERMITSRPEIGGKVIDLPLDVGDHFTAGQVIARLDTTTDEIELRIARSQAASADAAAHRVEVSLAQARKTLERTKSLVERGAAAVSSLEGDSLSVVQLTSDLDVARQAAETAGLQVERQERNVALHQIVAPFDGVIVTRLVGLGDMVASGTDGGGPRDGIAILLDPNSLTIDVDIAQSNAARIEPGQPAVAVLDAFPDRKFRMRVRTIVSAASLQKGTVTARLEFLTPPSRVLPNMAAKVTLDAPELQANTNERGL